MPITLNGDTGIQTPMYNGTITANAVTPSVNMKSRIINGAMVIDQRNASASVTPASGQYTLDRWTFSLSQASKISTQQSSTAPAGFVNSSLITSLSSYSVSAGEFFLFHQAIEGYNIADLGWGTANAKTVTLSFWVRSSLTGTFGGSLSNSATNRSYPFTYTISAANTFEYKTVTIAGDTSGTWLTTNGIGMYVFFGLGVGSTYSGTAGAWAGSGLFSATGATSVVGTNGATFYITGVQLEVGSTATSFDYRPYGTELALCQRYYFNQSASGNAFARFGSGITVSTSQAQVGIKMPVTMRTAPALTTSGTASHYNVYTGSNFACTSVPAIDQATSDFVVVQFNTAASMTANSANFGAANNSTSAFLGFSSEL